MTRRDFVNGALLGAGAALLARAAPSIAGSQTAGAPAADWYGYGGVGDYAASHGNTPQVVADAHLVRDGAFTTIATQEVIDTAEHYHVVVVGCGIAGLAAAYEFDKSAPPGARALLLDNHPVFGGESKRNEFDVRGTRLIAPQGANGFFTPPVVDPAIAVGDPRWYDEIGVPRSFDYVKLPKGKDRIRVANDNFGFMYWMEHTANIGYAYRGSPGSRTKLVRDQWATDLHGTPHGSRERDQLLTWRRSTTQHNGSVEFGPWLDSMSYRDYIEKVMGLGRHVTTYADPIVASTFGLGCDAVSAYAAFGATLPGVSAYSPPADREFGHLVRNSFPGGNDGFARHFLKRINPRAIRGTDEFADVITQPIDFAALDHPAERCRLRLDSTVVDVRHDGPAERSTGVRVIYRRNGRLYAVRAQGVVSAAGGWIAKHVVRDLPTAHREAYDSFVHAPFMIANVALTNWRFMYDAGISACRYFEGLGFSCNIRQPMIVGDYRPALDPDKPAVLTFYVPFLSPGDDPRAQGTLGRAQLFGTSYADYERQLLRQLRTIFGRAFQPHRDVAGVILNRWGHAYSVPTPGFYFGRGGLRPARDVIREPFGRIAFGHSELFGLQHWGYAADEGQRAMRQVLAAAG